MFFVHSWKTSYCYLLTQHTWSKLYMTTRQCVFWWKKMGGRGGGGGRRGGRAGTSVAEVIIIFNTWWLYILFHLPSKNTFLCSAQLRGKQQNHVNIYTHTHIDALSLSFPPFYSYTCYITITTTSIATTHNSVSLLHLCLYQWMATTTTSSTTINNAHNFSLTNPPVNDTVHFFQQPESWIEANPLVSFCQHPYKLNYVNMPCTHFFKSDTCTHFCESASGETSFIYLHDFPGVVSCRMPSNNVHSALHTHPLIQYHHLFNYINWHSSLVSSVAILFCRCSLFVYSIRLCTFYFAHICWWLWQHIKTLSHLPGMKTDSHDESLWSFRSRQLLPQLLLLHTVATLSYTYCTLISPQCLSLVTGFPFC